MHRVANWQWQYQRRINFFSNDSFEFKLFLIGNLLDTEDLWIENL